MSDTSEYNWVSMGNYYNYPEAWECPRCHVMNAPHANYCENCKPVEMKITTDSIKGYRDFTYNP